jgi:hypothetical protein
MDVNLGVLIEGGFEEFGEVAPRFVGGNDGHSLLGLIGTTGVHCLIRTNGMSMSTSPPPYEPCPVFIHYRLCRPTSPPRIRCYTRGYSPLPLGFMAQKENCAACHVHTH